MLILEQAYEVAPLSDCYKAGTGRCGGHLYSILRNNRFPNVKEVPSSVKLTLEESLFFIHNSRSVSESLLAFGRKDFTELMPNVVLPGM